MILQERLGRSQNSQDVFVHRSCKCIEPIRHLYNVELGDLQLSNAAVMPYSSSLTDAEIFERKYKSNPYTTVISNYLSALRGANLTDAKLPASDRLRSAKLKGAIMPDGTVHD